MNVGQKVRVRDGSSLARDWDIPRDAQGTVLCRYRLLRDRQDAPDRLDVRFSSQVIVWGASEGSFEVIAEHR